MFLLFDPLDLVDSTPPRSCIPHRCNCGNTRSGLSSQYWLAESTGSMVRSRPSTEWESSFVHAAFASLFVVITSSPSRQDLFTTFRVFVNDGYLQIALSKGLLLFILLSEAGEPRLRGKKWLHLVISGAVVLLS